MSDFNVDTVSNEPTPTPSDTGVPAVQPAIPAVTPQPATSVETQPEATPPGGRPQGQGMVPSYRIREASEAGYRRAQQEAAQRLAAIQAEAERYKQQLHSLVGVTPQQDPEVDAIRQQFSRLYPGLAQLEQKAKDLEALLGRAGELEQSTNHYWDTHARQSVERLYSLAEDSLGMPLNEEAKRQLHTSFVGFVQSSPEMHERYSNDPTIVEDFWKAFTSSFIDPIRRTAVTQTVQRVPQGLPQDTPAGMPGVQSAPKPANLDERVAQGWAAYQQQRRQ